jgi:hypothetical protein
MQGGSGSWPRRIKSDDDQDVHTGWRRVMCTYQRAGQASKAKRRTRRRERRELDRALRRDEF